MKYMCIATRWVGMADLQHYDGPKYGEIVTVTKEKVIMGYRVYDIAEYPDPTGWSADCFIPLSSIDETEMIREYQKQTV